MVNGGILRATIKFFVMGGVVGVFNVDINGFARVFWANLVGRICRASNGFAIYQPLVMSLGSVNAIAVVNGRVAVRVLPTSASPVMVTLP